MDMQREVAPDVACDIMSTLSRNSRTSSLDSRTKSPDNQHGWLVATGGSTHHVVSGAELDKVGVWNAGCGSGGLWKPKCSCKLYNRAGAAGL